MRHGLAYLVGAVVATALLLLLTWHVREARAAHAPADVYELVAATTAYELQSDINREAAASEGWKVVALGWGTIQPAGRSIPGWLVVMKRAH